MPLNDIRREDILKFIETFTVMVSFVALVFAIINKELNLIIISVALLLTTLFIKREIPLSIEDLGFIHIRRLLKIDVDADNGYVWFSMPRATNFKKGYFIPPDENILKKIDDIIRHNQIPFIISPPGTGKTWFALYYGYEKFMREKTEVFYASYSVVLNNIMERRNDLQKLRLLLKKKNYLLIIDDVKAPTIDSIINKERFENTLSRLISILGPNILFVGSGIQYGAFKTIIPELAIPPLDVVDIFDSFFEIAKRRLYSDKMLQEVLGVSIEESSLDKISSFIDIYEWKLDSLRCFIEKRIRVDPRRREYIDSLLEALIKVCVIFTCLGNKICILYKDIINRTVKKFLDTIDERLGLVYRINGDCYEIAHEVFAKKLTEIARAHGFAVDSMKNIIFNYVLHAMREDKLSLTGLANFIAWIDTYDLDEIVRNRRKWGALIRRINRLDLIKSKHFIDVILGRNVDYSKITKLIKYFGTTNLDIPLALAIYMDEISKVSREETQKIGAVLRDFLCDSRVQERILKKTRKILVYPLAILMESLIMVDEECFRKKYLDAIRNLVERDIGIRNLNYKMIVMTLRILSKLTKTVFNLRPHQGSRLCATDEKIISRYERRNNAFAERLCRSIDRIITHNKIETNHLLVVITGGGSYFGGSKILEILSSRGYRTIWLAEGTNKVFVPPNYTNIYGLQLARRSHKCIIVGTSSMDYIIHNKKIGIEEVWPIIRKLEDTIETKEIERILRKGVLVFKHNSGIYCLGEPLRGKGSKFAYENERLLCVSILGLIANLIDKNLIPNDLELTLGLKSFGLDTDVIKRLLRGEHIIHLPKVDTEIKWQRIRINIKSIEVLPAELGSFYLVCQQYDVEDINTVLIVDIGYRETDILLVKLDEERPNILIHKSLDIKSIHDILETL